MSEEQIAAVYDLAQPAPTGFNQSPLRITLVQSADTRKRLVAQMPQGNRPKTAAAADAITTV